MKWHHGLRFKIMWIIVLAMVLMGGLFSYQSDQEAKEAMARKTSETARFFKEIVWNQIENRGANISMAVESLLNNREMVAAFAARDREGLARLTTAFYKQRLEPQYKIDQFQFHLPPAVSFLRAHKPEQFGDDLSTFRQTVLVANQTRKPVVGLEVGRGGPGLRVVYPVMQNQEHIGSVELGGSLSDVFSSARKTTGLEFAIGIKESVFKVAKRFTDTKADVVVGEMVYYDFSDPAIRSLPPLVAQVEQNTPIVVQGKSWSSWSFPLNDFSGQEIGVVLVLDDVSTLLAEARSKSFYRILLIMVLSLVASAGLFAMMQQLVLTPVNQVVALTLRLAEGDLTVALDRGRKDEIGALIYAMGIMVVNLRHLMGGIVQHGGALTGSATNLNRVADQLSVGAQELQNRGEQGNTIGVELNETMSGVDQAVHAMTEYMARLLESSQEINYNMGTISAAAEEASSNLGTVANSAGKLSQGMQDVLGATERSNGNIATVAAAVEEMHASLNEVNKRCSAAAAESEEARRAVEANAEVMAQLEESAQEISAVVGMIQSIAEQTNMLALNASIEAAGAGDAGKGFAVVANEVKELARQTGSATDQIQNRIMQIQQHTDSVNRAMEGMNHRVLRIRQVNGEILEAMVEQSSTVSEIARSMGAAAQETSSVSRLVEEITQDVMDVTRSVQEISLGIGEVTRNVSSASLGVEGMTHAVERTSVHGELITSAVKRTVQQAGELSGHMGDVLVSAERMRQISGIVTRSAKDSEGIANMLDQELRKFRI
ncbi:MAG: methyl-accepting chemotaxis protein [Magnetococcus sp. YQC-5]